MTRELRYYQRDAIDAVFSEYGQGRKSTLIVLATGCGKTFTAATLAHEHCERRTKKPRVLMLAHREELVDQALDTFGAEWQGVSLGKIQGAQCQFGRDVTVGMIQTAMQPAKLARLAGQTYDVIIVDEAHHSAATSYRRVLGRMRNPETLTLGLTATPNRGDGLGLHTTYDCIAYSYDLPQAIQDGYLVDLEGVRVFVDLSLDQVDVKKGDFAEGSLQKVMMQPRTMQDTLRAYQDHMIGRKVAGFGVRKPHVEALTDLFRAAGIPTAYVTGETPTDERRRLYRDLREGTLRVLWNVAVLTEGWDEPSVDGILQARPTGCHSLYTQIVGRGARLYPGKANCRVVDITGTMDRLSLMSVPMLGGLPHIDRTTGDGEKKERDQVTQRTGSVEYAASFLACSNASKRVDMLRVPRGQRYEWADTQWGLALSLGSPEAGWFVVRRHGEKDGIQKVGLYKYVYIHRVKGVASDYDQDGAYRVEVLATGLRSTDAIGIAEQEAQRFAPTRQRPGGAIGPASPEDIELAVRDISARTAEINAQRSRPLDNAGLAASASAVQELRRRGVKMTDTQALGLTHGEAEAMLRKGRAAGWRMVRMPERLREVV